MTLNDLRGSPESPLGVARLAINQAFCPNSRALVDSNNYAIPRLPYISRVQRLIALSGRDLRFCSSAAGNPSRLLGVFAAVAANLPQTGYFTSIST
jgi:hypothetical protein